MKNKLLIIVLIYFASVNYIFAQLTSQNSIPSPGQSYLCYYSDTNAAAGDASDTAVWDFDTIPVNDTLAYNYLSPSSTRLESHFPDADLAFMAPDGSYQFFTHNNDSFTRLGSVSGDQSFIIPLDDPEVTLQYPIGYDSVYRDTFAASFFNVVNYYRFGKTTINCDGLGTLHLPYGKIDNVLRIKTTRNYTDEYTLNNEDQEVKYSGTTYQWYIPGFPFPVLSKIKNTISGKSQNYLLFIDKNDISQYLTTHKNQEINNQLLVYPNPASNTINIKYQLHEINSVRIFSATGKIMFHQSPAASINEMQINCQGFPKGLYILHLETKQGVCSQKLVIQ